MSKILFEIFVTPPGARKFVQDWIHTEASLWDDVQVSIVRNHQDCLYSLFIFVPDPEQNAYVRDKLFGKGGELTKKYWFPIFHE